MKLNRRRTAITFIGIVFMVMLMTCVYAGKRTVLDYMEKIAALDKGSWHLIAYDMTAEEVSEVTAMDEVESFGLSSPLGVLDLPQTGNKPFIDVKEYSPESFKMLNIEVIEGRLPENENELIITSTAAEECASIKIGDKISGEFFDRTITGIKQGVSTAFPFDGIELHYGETVTVPASFMPYSENDTYSEGKAPNGNRCEFTVVGIMAPPSFEKSGGASYPALCGMRDINTHDKADLNILLRIDTKKVRDVVEFKERLDSLLGRDTDTDANNILLVFSAASGDSSFNSIVLFIEVFFTLFIMAASVILIYNVFNMSFAERTRYLGMLSSVGATRRQKRQSIFYECFSLLLPALPAGLLLGCAVIMGAMQLLKPRLDTLIAAVQMGMEKGIPVHLSVRFEDVCVIIVLCIVTVLLSALIPAVKISRIGPVESIRGAAENTKKKRFRTRKSLLERCKPELLLAVNGTSRSKHLTRGIMRSICVFAVLTMVTLYGADSIVKVAETLSDDSGWNSEYKGYDYILSVRTNTANYSAAKELLEREHSVKDIKELISVYQFDADGGIMSDEFYDAYKDIFLQFSDNTEGDWERWMRRRVRVRFDMICVDDEEFKTLAARGDSDMSIAEDTGVPSALIYNEMFFSTERYKMGTECKGYKYIKVNELTKLDIGDTFELSGYNTERREKVGFQVRLAGRVDENSLEGRLKICADCPYLIINRSALEKAEEACDPYAVSCMLIDTDGDKDGRFVKELYDIAEKSSSEEDGEIIVMDYENRNSAANIKQVITEIVKILAYCFTALISVVCLLNLYNSIRGRAAERTKETAVLRSVGMTDRQLTKMHDLENLMIFGKGIGLAAVICAALSAVIKYSIVSYFGNVELPLPLLLSACIAAGIFAASSIMTRICTRDTEKDGIIEKIRRETV